MRAGKLGKVYTVVQLEQLALETDAVKRKNTALDIILNLLEESAETGESIAKLLTNEYHRIYEHPVTRFFLRAHWSDFEIFLVNVPLLARYVVARKPALLAKGATWLNENVKAMYSTFWRELYGRKENNTATAAGMGNIDKVQY